MKLDFSQVQAITLGADRLEQREDGIHFFRFTKEQEELYATMHPQHVPKTLAPTGIKLSFRTDSRALSLSFFTQLAGSRSYFSIDLFVNGVLFDDICNFDETQILRKYTESSYELGDFTKEFDLGEGDKDVLIHLPFSVLTVLKDISLDDGSSFLPLRPEKKLLCFGDSITQGYDALHPSRRYTAQLAAFLGMEEHNKGIGGERFFPELAATKEPFIPDQITVAYGTNDWRHLTQEEFQANCAGFYQNLAATYPDTPILAITPLWRKVCENDYLCGPYHGIDAFIRQTTASMKNVTVISGFDFIPHCSDYFGDLTLHPNGAGFDRYFEGLKAHFSK